MDDLVDFFAAGTPSTKGSARGHPYQGKDGKWHASVRNDAGEKAKSWAAVVGDAAREAMVGRPLFDGAVCVLLTFYVKRPKSHYRTNKTLKPWAPVFAPHQPDGDKLVRCAWDALTGVVFTDDAQIVQWPGSKRYTLDGRTGVHVRVRPVALTVAELQQQRLSAA